MPVDAQFSRVDSVRYFPCVHFAFLLNWLPVQDCVFEFVFFGTCSKQLLCFWFHSCFVLLKLLFGCVRLELF